MSFEIIIDCIMALGALTTAATFVLVLVNQKGTQKQIDSLSKMADMFSKYYQLERIQAGSNIYPKIQISLKNDPMWGVKIQIKNNSYPVEVYRIIIYEDREHFDIKIKPKSEYIQIRQGEIKYILPGELSRQPLYTFRASIRIYLITPFEEAYEVRYMATDQINYYQSEPIPILYSRDEHEFSKTQVTQIKQYSIHGGIKGAIKDNFPEVARELED
ncbi:hypothetical protein [uncultured Phocaeicola sp.]|uniref:hypothetical protein n=1 Tax=uncultured Phocaeicola sp. TaxID=990718 RepID=UPI002598F490|nr:hypothetical protein [uncultured Phocaeicola sp.]